MLKISQLDPGYFLKNHIVCLAAAVINIVKPQRNRRAPHVAMIVPVNQRRAAYIDREFLRNSRLRASISVSPSSTLPPGNSHLSGKAPPTRRWQTSNLPSLQMSPATTLIVELFPDAIIRAESAIETES